MGEYPVYVLRTIGKHGSLRRCCTLSGCTKVHAHYFFSYYFFSLIADGPRHYRPACGHEGSSHLSPVHALQFLYRDASSALLQLVNLWLNFTYSRSHAFRKKEHKSYFCKNRTHDFRTSRCAAHLLDHSGDESYAVESFRALLVILTDC